MGIVDEAMDYMKKLFEGNSGGHDSDHTMRVYRNAMLLAEAEKVRDLELVALASLLHDVDDHKLFHTDDNRNARTFLEANHVDKSRIDEICRAISSVSFSRNRDGRPETLEAMVVQDADRLDAIGAIGIARTFAYGGEHGREVLATVGHFHDKLLKLRDLMNTDTAKALARQRHDFMVNFLCELDRELGGESG